MKIHNLDLNKDQFDLFLNGDDEVFRYVFMQYHKSLYRYANNVLEDQFISEEVVQIAFIQLFKYRKRINTSNGIYPYLFVIVKRLTYKAFKQRVSNLALYGENESINDIDCRNTEQELAFNDLKHTLNKLIDNLPAKQSEIYRLNKLQGYSYEEISAITGSSKNTIKNQLICASKKIRSSIARLYYFF